MTELYLSQARPLALRASLWLGCGALIGASHFLTLQTSVRLFVTGGSPLLAMALQVGRLVLLAGALAVIVGFGALPLLLATAGILIGRTAALRLGGQS